MPTHGPRILRQHRAVDERDFEQWPRGAAASTGCRRFQNDLAAKFEDGRILHARPVVDRSKGCRAIDQHQRQGVLDVDIRRIAIVDDGAWR